MASQGPLFAASAANISAAPENSNLWVDPGNVGANDAAEATITASTYDSPDISYQLRAYNYGFSIPAGATINGIIVEIERRSIIANSGKDFRVQLSQSGTVIGANKAVPATIWPTTATIATYGSSSDMWTTTLSAADINDPNFGVNISCQANIANADVGIDFVRMTVHYTAPQPVDPGLQGPGVMFDPTVVPGSVTVSPESLSLGIGILFTPTSINHVVAIPVLGGAQIFAPTDFVISDPNQQVVPDLLGPSLIHDPVVSAGSISAGMDLLGGAVVLTPTVALAPYVVATDLLGTATLFGPSLQSTVLPDLIGGATLFAPQLAIVQAVQVGLLGGATVFSPSVAMAPVNLFPVLLGTAVVLTPTLGQIEVTAGGVISSVAGNKMASGISLQGSVVTGHTP